MDLDIPRLVEHLIESDKDTQTFPAVRNFFFVCLGALRLSVMSRALSLVRLALLDT